MSKPNLGFYDACCSCNFYPAGPHHKFHLAASKNLLKGHLQLTWNCAERAKPNATTERLATEFATYVGNLKLIAGRLQ
jgi:hypothetical protein